MDEVFRILGQVEVNYVGDVFDVQAACGDVGGDQDLESSGVEPGECGIALSLAAVTMNHGCREAVADEFLGEPLGTALGAREDNVLPSC